MGGFWLCWGEEIWRIRSRNIAGALGVRGRVGGMGERRKVWERESGWLRELGGGGLFVGAEREVEWK